MHDQHRAEFNLVLQQRVAACSSWIHLSALVLELQQKGQDGWGLVNYISLAQMCGRLGALAGPGEGEVCVCSLLQWSAQMSLHNLPQGFLMTKLHTHFGVVHTHIFLWRTERCVFDLLLTKGGSHAVF